MIKCFCFKKRIIMMTAVISVLFLFLSLMNRTIYADAIFSDTFSNGSASNWQAYRGTWSVVNGQYKSGDSVCISALNTSASYANFVYDADVFVGNSYDGGLIFRSSNPANEDGYYVGLYAATDEVRLYKLATGEQITKVGIVISANTKNHVRVIADGSNIKIFVNNLEKPLIDVNDSTYSAGYIGVRSFCTNASFDNITVTRPKLIKKVLVLNFDPTLENRNNQKVHQYCGFNDPRALASTYISDLKECSDNQVYYQIVSWADLEEFPALTDGFQYTDDSYASTWDQAKSTTNGMYWQYSGWHDSDWKFDYMKYLNDGRFNIINKINNGSIDEVWLFGGIFTGMSESIMAGNGAYNCNDGLRRTLSTNTKPFVIMGFSYERGVGEMLEDFGHRTESIMSHVFGKAYIEGKGLNYRYYDDYGYGTRWITAQFTDPRYAGVSYNDLTPWEKFTLHEYYSQGDCLYNVTDFIKNIPTTTDGKPIMGCGRVHFSPNSTQDYDWGNNTYVASNYNDWKNNYPSMTGTYANVNSNLWGDGDIRAHHKWWLSCLPKKSGYTSDSMQIQYDWWQYITLNIFK